MSKHYNLVLFAACYREYIEIVLNMIDPKREFIVNVLSRDSCTVYNNNFIKDFRIVGNNNVQKEDLIMLDNKVVSFGYNMFQGVPILPYYNDESDTELRDIIPFLTFLSTAKDIKHELKQRYRYLYDRTSLLTFNKAGTD